MPDEDGFTSVTKRRTRSRRSKTAMAVVAEEWCGRGDPPFRYVRGRLRPVAQRRRQASQGVRELCRSVFMPQGFPESVSPDYVEYQVWDSVQACE